MFCTKCGNKLKDGAKFCTACGQKVEAMPIPFPAPAQAPEVHINMAPQQEPAAPEAPAYVPAPPVEPEIPAAPIVQNSLDPMAPPVEPEAPASGPIVQNSLDPMAPPVEPETPLIYADTDPDLAATEEKPKKKKKGLLIGIICGVVAVVAAVAIFLGISLNEKGKTYAQAMDLMAQKNYTEAMALFEELGNYKESAALLEDLQEKQEAYNEAVALLNERKYAEAIEAFDELGDYADSAEQAAYNVNYQKAKYLMECAASGSTEALSLVLEEGTAVSDEEGYASTLMYEIAGTIFVSLGDYSDSADLANDCYFAAGEVQLQCGNWEEALSYMEKMDEETAAEFHETYLSYCADSTVLEDMKAMLVEIAEIEDAAEANAVELSYMEKYADAYFDDEALQEQVLKYLEAVYMQRDVLDTMDSNFDSKQQYRYGACLCAEVVDALYADFGFLADDEELVATQVGWTDYNWAYYYLVGVFYPSLDGADTVAVDGQLYLTVNNTTDYDATIVYTITCSKDGTNVYESGELTLAFAAGETVQIPLGIAEGAYDFDRWNISYHFEDLKLDGELLAQQD